MADNHEGYNLPEASHDTALVSQSFGQRIGESIGLGGLAVGITSIGLLVGEITLTGVGLIQSGPVQEAVGRGLFVGALAGSLAAAAGITISERADR
jgi:hypothetical protein